MSGRLTLHSADLDQDGCFDEIFKGCNGVAHVSHVSDYTDHAYIKRVCDHIIQSVNASGTVTRVIVTSSVAAVISEMDLEEIGRRPVFYEDRYPDDATLNRTEPGLFDGQNSGRYRICRAAGGMGAGIPLLVVLLTTLVRFYRRIKKTWSLAKSCEHDARGDYEQNWVYRPWFQRQRQRVVPYPDVGVRSEER